MTDKIPSELAALQRYDMESVDRFVGGESHVEEREKNTGEWVKYDDVAHAWSQRAAALRGSLTECVMALERCNADMQSHMKGCGLCSATVKTLAGPIERARTLLGESHE